MEKDASKRGVGKRLKTNLIYINNNMGAFSKAYII
jgi:hypothetical protein